MNDFLYIKCSILVISKILLIRRYTSYHLANLVWWAIIHGRVLWAMLHWMKYKKYLQE